MFAELEATATTVSSVASSILGALPAVEEDNDKEDDVEEIEDVAVKTALGKELLVSRLGGLRQEESTDFKEEGNGAQNNTQKGRRANARGDHRGGRGAFRGRGGRHAVNRPSGSGSGMSLSARLQRAKGVKSDTKAHNEDGSIAHPVAAITPKGKNYQAKKGFFFSWPSSLGSSRRSRKEKASYTGQRNSEGQRHGLGRVE